MPACPIGRPWSSDTFNSALEQRRHRRVLGPVERPLVLPDHNRVPPAIRVCQLSNQRGGLRGVLQGYSGPWRCGLGGAGWVLAWFGVGLHCR